MELTSATAHAVVEPAAGGRLASLVVHGHELLVTAGRADDPMRWGCFPMVPWAGRIRDGVLTFGGVDHELGHDLGPHAIHGTGYRSSWDVVGDGRLSHVLDGRWPFGGHVIHEVELDDDRLRCRLEVVAGEVEMPAMAGWHPWFRRSLRIGDPVCIDVGATKMWERGDDGIPTGRLVDVPAGPWDDCFTGLRHDPVLTWPGALRCTLRSSCEHWVIYDEPTDAVCVEPQTGPPNQPNVDPTILAPHGTLVATFEISWRSLR